MTASATPRFQNLPDVGVIDDGEVVVRNGDLFEGTPPSISAVDLDAAIALVNAALADKQDAATAATDAELAAVSDSVDDLAATKQDAATAATDAELTAAVATINTALALKQDAATAATDAELTAHANDDTFVHNVSQIADQADSRFPTSGQKAALVGTSGTPGSGNKYVTDGDSRNTNSRTPTSHSHPTSEVTGLDAALAGLQPLDSDLTSIAALSTTSTGRSLLAIANAAAGRTILSAAAATHTHAESDVTNLTSDLAAKQASSEKGQPSGYASLDSGGKIPSSQIAAIALVTPTVVGSQAAQLALTAQAGDVAIRSDESKTYMHNGGTAGTMADWTFLQTPASSVLSVNGQTGAVSLTYTDVGAASTSDSRLSDNRAPTDGSVTAAKVNTTLKPSGTAAAGDESLRALGTSGSTATAGNDSRLSDTRTPTDGSVTAAKVNTALKPSGTAAASDESLRALGVTASTAAAGNDSRLSDTRTPSGAAGGVLSGTFPSPGFAADMATQAELDAAIATAQPLDSDLTAIAALATTSYGRAFLALADAAAGRTALGAAASSHSHAESDITNLTTDLAGKQPLDSDLTSIAALATTSFGRGLLEVANAAAGRTALSAAVDTVDAAAGTGSLRTLGTSATSAAAGNDVRLADSRAPSGSAGGVLSGTYPSPGFAVDMATQAELDAVSSAVSANLNLASREKWSNA